MDVGCKPNIITVTANDPKMHNNNAIGCPAGGSWNRLFFLGLNILLI
jgi:hypothetical protein